MSVTRLGITAKSRLSSRPDDVSLWSVSHFVAELARVRDVLGPDDVHVVGHSWGAMLLAAYLSTGPSGVRTATLSSLCLDARQWARDPEVHLAAMSPDCRAVAERCQRDGTGDSEEYETALEVPDDHGRVLGELVATHDD